MKTFSILILALLSFNAFACPNLTGSFLDDESESTRKIIQDGCTSTTWSDEDGATTLLADHVERVLQQEGTMTAFAKVYFTNEDLVIDIRMDYGAHNDLKLPVRWITSYHIDGSNDLVEKIEPFSADGSKGKTEFVKFKRIKATASSFIQKIDKKLSHDFNDACYYDELETAKTLSTNPSVDINFTDAAGRTGLLNAVMMENADIVAFLVKLPNINLNKRDKAGTYPLFYAEYLGNHEIINILKAAGAKEQ